MGHSDLKLKTPRAALKAFEQALAIHPGMDSLRDVVKTLQEVLGE